MNSRIYGVLTCVTFSLTIVAYSPFLGPLESQNPASRTVDHQIAGLDSTRQETTNLQSNGDQVAVTAEAQMVAEEEKATSLAAVGWKGCHWCERFKAETLPDLVDQGYDVRYVDIGEWKGPKVTTGPTLFFFVNRDKIVKVHKGYLTADQVKEYLRKPGLK